MDSNEQPDLSAVGDAHASGMVAWPGVSLPLEAFASHVHARLGEADDIEVLTRHGTDLFLACACARGDSWAIDYFSKHFLGAVPALVAHIMPPSLTEELVQSLHEQMLVRRDDAPPQIAAYRGTGSLAGWVRISATRAALRMRARAARFTSDADLDAVTASRSTSGPEVLYAQRTYGPSFQVALNDALAALPAAPRELLCLYYLEERTIDELAARYGIHRATAARRVDAARRLLLTDARRRAAERLQLADAELDSLLPLLVSRLDLSLHRLASDDA